MNSYDRPTYVLEEAPRDAWA